MAKVDALHSNKFWLQVNKNLDEGEVAAIFRLRSFITDSKVEDTRDLSAKAFDSTSTATTPCAAGTHRPEHTPNHTNNVTLFNIGVPVPTSEHYYAVKGIPDLQNGNFTALLKEAHYGITAPELKLLSRAHFNTVALYTPLSSSWSICSRLVQPKR